MVKSTFKTVREFVDHVGRDNLRRQGAYDQIFGNWMSQGHIPAVWLPVFYHLYGPNLPMHLFKARRFKPGGYPPRKCEQGRFGLIAYAGSPASESRS